MRAMNKPKLTKQLVTELGGALDRLEVLSQQSIFTTETAAEKRGQEAFLQRALLEHAPELLGAWVTIQEQYAPLVRGFAALTMNASLLLAPQPKAEEPKPEETKDAAVKPTGQ